MTEKTISKKKLQEAPLVILPRTQLRPSTATAQRQDFTARCIDIDGTQFWLLEQTGEPRMVFQVFTAANEQDFDILLGRLLGMNERPSYHQGQTAACVLFVGNRDYIEITQANHRQVYDHIGRIQDRAAAWLHTFGASIIEAPGH